MENTFTTNFLISVLYKENFKSEAERSSAQSLIDEDISLNQRFQELKMAKDSIPLVKFRPSNKTIQNILEYSKAKPSIEAAV